MEPEEKFEDAQQRMLARCEIDPVTGCWNYTGGTRGNGYGQISFNGGCAYTHRLSAMIFLDFAPEPGRWVLHRCDNPLCFNPEHLFIGSPGDNSRDAVIKGRMSGKKLGVDEVIEIKRLLSEGASQRSLATAFGVTASAIGQIARGETWKEVCPPASEGGDAMTNAA